ncbi:MAG: hypothetical protein E6K76_10985 [Candidatus Eisenbacteria bacterium]|uniref:Uncharacterized protein n=1 Tax=Eiseniibacteriota bacterium TaxID=2212470 RepID=A0A538T0V0_UNCEI|nr:MAG: hypothetical protein E6K76_10985 [Candidatus Eisenbacteria bacterium]
MAGMVDKLLGLDRRWIFLFVLICVGTPIVLPIGLPVTTTGSTRAAFDYIESLKPGDYVWVSFDYGPSSAPENDPMAEAIMRQCFTKKIRVIVCALYPLGGLGLATNSLAKVTAEFPNLRYGEEYVNLGYKDGASAVMRRLGEDIAGAFPTDVKGRPLAQVPMMQGLRSIRQVQLVFTAATGIIGEWWITQVHSQIGTPVIIGPTAVSAPKYYAYLNAGQLVGMLGGMKGAAEYEKLLAARYPDLARFYQSTRGFTATKGMDGQAVTHAVIILFILIGNVAYLSRRAAQRKGA